MQMSVGKGLVAGAIGAAVVLTITAAASGGQVPPTAKSAGKAANVTASLPGSIGTGTFVRGGGHVVTAEVQLNVGQRAALFSLPGYGKFGVACVHAPLAEVDYTVGKRRVHLWTQQGGAASEQDMPPGSGLGIQTGVTPAQIQWTIQDASSARLSANVATVQTDETVNGNNTSKCDFAAVAYAGP